MAEWGRVGTGRGEPPDMSRTDPSLTRSLRVRREPSPLSTVWNPWVFNVIWGFCKDVCVPLFSIYLCTHICPNVHSV